MRIGELAQQIMDEYYQQVATDEDFFSLEDFVSRVKSTYSSIITEYYQSDKLLNRQIDGFSYVTVPLDLLRYETVEVREGLGKVKYAPFEHPIFLFPYDSMVSGLQSVRQLREDGSLSSEFVKISVNDTWKTDHIKHGSKNYYSTEFKRVVFQKLHCKDLKKVVIGYVPQVSSFTMDDEINEGPATQIRIALLQEMLGAKNGAIVDKSNNSNPNKALETEIDSTQLKQQ